MNAKPWLKFYDAGVPQTISYPQMPLYRLLDDAAEKNPQALCCHFFGRWFTYRTIKEWSDRIAAHLLEAGFQPGEHIALLMPNSPQFILAYYAALKAGMVVVALNPLSSARELEYQLDHSEAVACITIPMFLGKVLELLPRTQVKKVYYARLADFMSFPIGLLMRFRERSPLRAALNQGGTHAADFKTLLRPPVPQGFRPHPVDAQKMAVLIYSGGTTGIAKGIMLSHFNLVANAHQIVAWGQLNAQVRILAVLPFFHGYGMSVTMNAILLAGGQIILMPRFDARQVVRTIQKHQPNFFTGVPTMFVAFSNLPDIQKYDLSSLQGIFVGAAPLTKAIKENFEAKTGGRMIEGYGLTEAVTAIMANPYLGVHKVGSIGIPFPDVEAKIVSLEDERDLPPGEQGEIVLRSPTNMLGYFKNPQETRQTLRDGWLFTGDIGYMDEDGYFYITDRKKDLIIVGGFNVFPREIDELIYQHPKVKEGICVGIPDAYKGERIKVFIVLKEGEQASEEEFIHYFRQHLTPYKVPSEVEFRQELPKSMIGKILRRALREEELKKVAEKD